MATKKTQDAISKDAKFIALVLLLANDLDPQVAAAKIKAAEELLG